MPGSSDKLLVVDVHKAQQINEFKHHQPCRAGCISCVEHLMLLRIIPPRITIFEILRSYVEGKLIASDERILITTIMPIMNFIIIDKNSVLCVSPQSPYIKPIINALGLKPKVYILSVTVFK